MKFTVYCKPQPQGSAKAFVRGKHAVVTSDNKKLKPYRNEVTAVVLQACRDEQLITPVADKHIPVTLSLEFFFERPPSIPRKRFDCVVKPDLDKLVRATLDALTGVLFARRRAGGVRRSAQMVWQPGAGRDPRRSARI